MKIKELIKQLKSYPKDMEIAYSLWQEDDISENYKLTELEKTRVIFLMNGNQDCNNGLNWDVLDAWCDYVINERK